MNHENAKGRKHEIDFQRKDPGHPRHVIPFPGKRFFIYMLLILAAGCSAADDTLPGHRLYDLSRKKEITLGEALADLSKKRIVLVGEFHSQRVHHENQLQIIRTLFEDGVPLAVGFEMFQHESQPALDRWVSGKMDAVEFRKVYDDNWNFPWDLYRPIFEYARENRIPMVGLNVPREITRQVARSGFNSLTGAQKERLPEVACRVDEAYMDFIRKAFGAHAHGQFNFTHFCEAQLVWDSVMAANALEFLKDKPDWTMVLIAGTGHARKKGIPEQIRKRANLPVAVVLPEVPGDIDSQTVTEADADYLMMHR